MSKHIGRKQRWTQVDARTYISEQGKVAYQQDAWYGLLEYRRRIGFLAVAPGRSPK